MPQTATPAADVPATQWWERRRLLYNLALVAAIILGFFAYVAVVSYFADTVKEVEFTVFTVGFQCCGAGIGLLFANLFYFLGAAVEGWVPPARIDTYRKWAWRAGVVFSCFLPFSIALLHLVLCLFFPSWYDQGPVRAAGA